MFWFHLFCCCKIQACFDTRLTSLICIKISRYCRPYYGYYGRGLMWLIILLFVIIVIAVVSISVGLHYGTGLNDLDALKEYALTDKVILSYKGDFCESLQTVSTDFPNSAESNATLYMLRSPPPLTDSESFNVSEPLDLDDTNNFHYWNFYLNTGSTLSIKVCYLVSSSY